MLRQTSILYTCRQSNAFNAVLMDSGCHVTIQQMRPSSQISTTADYTRTVGHYHVKLALHNFRLIQILERSETEFLLLTRGLRGLENDCCHSTQLDFEPVLRQLYCLFSRPKLGVVVPSRLQLTPVADPGEGQIRPWPHIEVGNGVWPPSGAERVMIAL